MHQSENYKCIITYKVHSSAFTNLQFHSFVSCYSSWSPYYPLRDMIGNNDKARRIVWTPETTAAYEEMKLQVSKCTTMRFVSDNAPIIFRLMYLIRTTSRFILSTKRSL